MLVRAVLVPQRAHDAEFGERRLAAQHLDDSLVFVLRQTVLRDERRRDGRVAGAGNNGHFLPPRESRSMKLPMIPAPPFCWCFRISISPASSHMPLHSG